MTRPHARALLIIGLVLLIAGALDPLEGSVVILLGSGVTVAAAVIGRMPERRLVVISFALISIGVLMLFVISSVGGIGGSSGRSYWWGTSILPYPFGWLTAIVATIRSLRASRPVKA